MGDPSLYEHLSGPLENLCHVTGIDPVPARGLLAALLGTAGDSPISSGPVWPSDVADDHSPVEFSIAFDTADAPPTRRLSCAPPAVLIRLSKVSALCVYQSTWSSDTSRGWHAQTASMPRSKRRGQRTEIHDAGFCRHIDPRSRGRP